MAKTKISEFDSTPANNTDIDSINIAEGCAPSGINNAIRELMSQLKDQQTGASGDNFTVGGNLAVTGTATLSTSLPIASGGTAASTAANARISLGAAASGANSDITSVTGLTTALTVAQGGTGAATHTSKGVLIGNGTSAITTVSPGTSGNVLTSDGTSWTSAAGAYVLTSGTAVASTSGTSIDFTSIPIWVKRVTVIGSEVSTNGTSSFLIQLGDSGGIEATGYQGGMFGNSNQTNTSTSGAVLMQSSNSASNTYSFSIVFSLESINKWVASGVTTRNDGVVFFTASFKSLSATLDRVRITTVSGTDTFDAGSINILYE